MNQTTTLHETAFTIKGNEPFLRYYGAGMNATLRDYSGQSHGLVEQFGGGISLSGFRKGDTIRLRLDRVRKVGWFKEIFRRIFG